MTTEAMCIKSVYKLDEIPDQKLLTEDEITKRLALSMEFEDIPRHEEIAWRQI